MTKQQSKVRETHCFETTELINELPHTFHSTHNVKQNNIFI